DHAGAARPRRPLDRGAARDPRAAPRGDPATLPRALARRRPRGVRPRGALLEGRPRLSVRGRGPARGDGTHGDAPPPAGARPRGRAVTDTAPTRSAQAYKVVVVMPAYNAGRTLRMTYADLPKDAVNLVILVDDGSSDQTIEIARELGLEIFVHDRNYGYGANQ